MNLREEITYKLNIYRTKLHRSFEISDSRIALFQLLRCIDHQTFFYRIYGQTKGQIAEEHISGVNRLFGWGLNEALSLFWRDQINQPGTPLFRSSQELEEWGDSLLRCAGRVRIVEHILELERVRLGRITRSKHDPNTFDFNYSEHATGVESIERCDADYFNILLERLHCRNQVWEKLQARRAGVIKEMECLVRPWRKFYISYGASPEVDDYYHDLAAAIAPAQGGWDAFPLQASFGGIPFIKYIDCVRTLMGFALKHIDFCILLCRRHTDINLIDILTLPCNWSDACRYVEYALNISETESQQVMLATSLTPENAEHHLKVPAGPMALHYMIGQGSVVRSITGCLYNPFYFLLRELRRQFPNDWDCSVDSREHIFRNELIALFSGF